MHSFMGLRPRSRTSIVYDLGLQKTKSFSFGLKPPMHPSIRVKLKPRVYSVQQQI